MEFALVNGMQLTELALYFRGIPYNPEQGKVSIEQGMFLADQGSPERQQGIQVKVSTAAELG